MQHIHTLGRGLLLALSLLSACAAADPSPTVAVTRTGASAPTGVFSDYMSGRFALNHSDANAASEQFLRALANQPDDQELVQQAFIATLISGRGEAVQLARALPDSQAAQLLLGGTEARAGHWAAAEEYFRALPSQGLTQVLQPLLVAWAQQGAGHTDQAMATLRPLIDGPRFRGVFALHAALIADQAGRNADAARLYRTAQVEFGPINFRLAQILASWQARQGHLAEAQRTLDSLIENAPDMAIAVPALAASSMTPSVPRPVDGIAEAYVALAATLRQQNSSDFAMVLLRLALELRPDFTPARLLAAETLENGHHLDNALQMLATVSQDDPLVSVVRLHRATLTELQGHTDEALRDLKRIAQDYPRSPLPAMREGDIARSKQRFGDAVAAYDRAVARITKPVASDWVVFYDRGICFERLHQWPKAEADFKHALNLYPDQPFVLNYLGYSWADMNQHLPEARSMIEKATQLRPNDGAIVDSLGWVMLRQGQLAEAVHTLERAVELNPDDASINGHLGDAYWAAGRKLEATYQWRRALTFNPEPDDAARLEAKLQNNRPVSVVSGQ